MFPASNNTARRGFPRPLTINEIEYQQFERLQTPDGELNRVLGGGIVPGSLVMIAGDPGIGKSTLMLQIALQLKDKKVLYVSGEESAQQIRMRAERITKPSDNCFILAETQMDSILFHANALTPDLLVIDSIQTLHTANVDSPAGSISQIR